MKSFFQKKSVQQNSAAEQITQKKNDFHDTLRAKESSANSLQTIVNNSPRVKQLQAVQEMADSGSKQQKVKNNTGLPDNLKSGIENLSGHSLDHVKVHYNSDRPAQLQAHAFAQGSDIHVAPGQEKHLPHEAWHVVQQQQGRVKANTNVNGVGVNDNATLENEADTMGEKATRFDPASDVSQRKLIVSGNSADRVNTPFQLKKLVKDKLNVVGEDHGESGQRRDAEIALGAREAGGKYYKEHEFKARPRTVGEAVFGESAEKPRAFADPLYLRIAHRVQFLEKFNLFHEIIPEWDITDIPKSTEVKTTGTNLITQSESNILELRGLIREAIKNEEKDKYTDAQVALLNDINTLNNGTLIPQFVLLKNEWAKITPGVALTPALTTPAAAYRTGVDDTLVHANSLGGNNLDETRIKRSEAMDTVSTSRKKDKGVWKIGQAHYNDIQGGAKEYNLISKDEFNTEYKELPILQGGVMVPQP